jgi:hypothetical protein
MGRAIIDVLADDKWLIAISTAVIAAFTVILVIVTNRQARLTKESVQIANRALTELEALVIGVKIIKPGIEWDMGKTNLSMGILQYAFVNYGRTPATLFEIVDDVKSVKVSEGLPPHIKSERGPPLPYGVFIPPNGETQPFNFNIFAQMLGIAANQPAVLKTTVPFFLGTARYGDIFGNLYTMGFCFMFDDVGNRFIEAGGPEHSYCRKERGPYKPPGSIRKNT